MYDSSEHSSQSLLSRRRHATALVRMIGAGLVSVSFAAAAVPVYVPVYNTLGTTVSFADSSGNGSVSGTTSAQHNYPRAGEPTSGFARVLGTTSTGIPVTTSGAFSRAGGDGGFSKTDATFSANTYVGNGTSGLALGTPIELFVDLKLDGNTSVTSGVDAGYASMSFVYNVRNPDQAVYSAGDGWSVPTIASFGADVDHSIDNFFTYYYDPAGGYYQSTSYTANWGWNSNLSAGSGVPVDIYSVSARSDVPYGSSSDARLFATGPVHMRFLANVGDTINLDSYLTVWSDTYGVGSSATLNYLNTFEASISTDVAGIELILGRATVVPLPAALWLFAPASVLLAAVRRRRPATAAAHWVPRLTGSGA